jgi:type IV fimbrial biogenesis protein FimT
MPTQRPGNQPLRSARRAAAGFTVIELMIVMAVTAILLALATPNLRGVLERNQLLGQANELAGAMALARSEAVSRGVQAGVCASDDDGATCGAAWTGNDVVVFIDENNDGSFTAGERVLKVLTTSPDLTVTGGANEFIFRSNGFGVITDADLNLTVCHEGTTNCRQVQVRPSGIVSVVRV